MKKNINFEKFVLLIYLSILVVPLFYTNFDCYSILFIVSFCLYCISVFSILKKVEMFSLLRIFFLMLPSLFYVLYMIPISTGFRGLKEDDILAVLQTNIQEITDYLLNKLNIASFLTLLCLYFAFIYLIVKQNKSKRNIIQNPVTALMCLVTSLFLMYFCHYNSLTKEIIEAFYTIQKYSDFYDSIKSKRKINNVKKNTPQGIYVVVIGESQNRNHMSVYGYKRHQTTPFLFDMKLKGNGLFFDNVYSCHTHTIPVLLYALTQKNNYNTLALQDSYTIMEVLQEFNTYWISNQKAIGYYGEPITEIGLQAKKSIFINKSFLQSNPYDADLLAYLPKEKSLKKTSVIFIHLMGNHFDYGARYPKSFGKWKNRYDNSILYNDYVVYKIYKHFSSMQNFMVFIYFSDHADDVRCKCHDASQFTWEMTKIPLYMFFSEAYMNKYPQKIKNLQEHLHAPFTNDMIFDSVLGILDIKDKRFYESENDLSSMQYNHTRENLSTLYGKKSLSEEI